MNNYAPKIKYTAIPGLKYRSSNSLDAEGVILTICNFMRISREQLTARCRVRKFVYSRQLVTYFILQYCNVTLKEAGIMMGGLDHTTAIHSRNVIRDLIFSDPRVQQDVMKLTTLLNKAAG